MRAQAIRTWGVERKKAVSTICATLDTGPMQEVVNILVSKTVKPTARLIIDRLDKLYEKANSGLAIYLTFERLIAMRYEDGTPVATHIVSICSLLDQLKSFGFDLSDELKGIILLQFLYKTTHWELFEPSYWPHLMRRRGLHMRQLLRQC